MLTCDADGIDDMMARGLVHSISAAAIIVLVLVFAIAKPYLSRLLVGHR